MSKIREIFIVGPQILDNELLATITKTLNIKEAVNYIQPKNDATVEDFNEVFCKNFDFQDYYFADVNNRILYSMTDSLKEFKEYTETINKDVPLKFAIASFLEAQ